MRSLIQYSVPYLFRQGHGDLNMGMDVGVDTVLFVAKKR